MTPTAGHVALSSQQRFLHLVDSGADSGPFGPRYTIVGGWRLTGPVRDDALRAALGDVVNRHEALRSRIVRDSTGAHQQVVSGVEPDLTVRTLRAGPAGRDQRAEELLNEVEADDLPLGRMPVLRAVLARFDAGDAVLVLAAHHTAVDGWSMQVIARDLAACYAGRLDGAPSGLPAVRQYREYVGWQQRTAGTTANDAARRYWRDALDGAEMTPLSLDVPRSAQGENVTSWHRYAFGPGVNDAVNHLARTHRCSPFMVMLAAYALLLRDRTGRDDLVVPTFTPGRRPGWTAGMAGVFFNMLPVRVRLDGRPDTAALMARVRAACLAAYRHELPFIDVVREAPGLMGAVSGEWHSSCTFQLVQFPMTATGERVGDVAWKAMRRRLLSAVRGSQIPDGALWTVELDPAGAVGGIGYGAAQFSPRTVQDLAAGYGRTLARILGGDDVP
ncbi:condensation protein [Actinoplanes sp. LDG1-06]|uniref:Condensation protein n=1 Tax=Paractinoplanes ovalisporus TaxID=2810368 RepID=A0ABS2AJV5_9ACTN|nr:condensation protein [Actinoplanes ovalisporus]